MIILTLNQCLPWNPYPCAIHQNIDFTKLGNDPLYHIIHFSLLSNINTQSEGPLTKILYLLRHTLELAILSHNIANAYSGTSLSKSQGYRSPYTSSASCHYRDISC
jgi:hypothetical protein